MRLAYLDCFSGIAGDMLLGALLDAGASQETVLGSLGRLPIGSWNLETHTVTRSGLRGLKAEVSTAPTPPRTLEEIEKIVVSAGLGEDIEQMVMTVFRLLAEAEARVHNQDVAHTHLHEAGDDDALIDVVGSCVALHDLGVEQIICSSLPLGNGIAHSAHGPIPVPAPVVTELLRGVPVVAGGEGEVTTPSGAALAVALSSGFGSPPPMTLQATGWGAGTAERDLPNLLRVCVGETSPGATDGVVIVEANIDDMTPELVADAADELLRNGALDVWISPVLMKKGRPGFVLHALAALGDAEAVRENMLRNTTSFGVRSTQWDRRILDRAWREISVQGHTVRIKVGSLEGHDVTSSVEHDDAAQAAAALGIPIKEVYRQALEAWAGQNRS